MELTSAFDLLLFHRPISRNFTADMSLLNTYNRIKFTAYVPVYDFVGRWFMGARRRAVGRLALMEGGHVLLVGAGTGLDLEVLPLGMRYTALDYTPAMLRRLVKRAVRLNQKVEAVVGDAGRLPFADEQFDAVTLHFVLEVLPDPQSALREAVRVLKPGGKLSLLDIFRPRQKAPGMGRRMLNALLVGWFSGLNLYPEAMLEGLPLKSITMESCAWRGNVRLLILEKTA